MRFNNMTKENEKKKDYSVYIIMAVILAFVSAAILNVLGKLTVMASVVIFKYWWAAIGLVLIIIIMRRRSKRKK